MLNKFIPFKNSFNRILYFLTLQVVSIIASKRVQSAFEQIVDYANILHLFFVSLVMIPYLSAIVSFLFFPSAQKITQKNVNACKYMRGSRILADLSLCVCLLIIAFSLYNQWLFRDLPVGYDTPFYLARAKLLIKQREVDLISLLIRRYIYFKFLSYLLALLNGNSLLLGKLLWMQLFPLIIANYFLVKNISNSKLIAFISSFLWIVWSRTTRLTWDLHSNTFAIFLVLTMYICISLFKESKKVITLLIFTTCLTALIHQLTLFVTLLVLIAYIVNIGLQNLLYRANDVHLSSSSKSLLRKIINVISILAPLLMFTLTSYGIVLINELMKLDFSYIARDLLRKWWPEIPMWNFGSFVNALGGPLFFILSEIGLMYMLSRGFRKPIELILFLHLCVSLLLSQNMILGLHALPERFLVFTFLPIYASLAFSVVEGFLRRFKLMFHIGKRSFMAKLSSVIIVLIFIIIALLLVPDCYLRIGKSRSTISLEEYLILNYLVKEHLSYDLTENKTILIVFQKWGLEYWIREIIPYAEYVKTGKNITRPGIYIIVDFNPKIICLGKWDIVYLFKRTGYGCFKNIIKKNMTMKINGKTEVYRIKLQKL